MAGMTIEEIEDALTHVEKDIGIRPSITKAALHGMDDYWQDLWNQTLDDDGQPIRVQGYLNRLLKLKQRIADQM